MVYTLLGSPALGQYVILMDLGSCGHEGSFQTNSKV